MKIDNPIKTRSGCIHQTSARIVCPNERRGNAAVSFTGRRLLPRVVLLFSTLPNYLERSKAHRILPASKCWWRCWRDIRSRSKPLSVCYDRVRKPVCATPGEKYGVRQEPALFSILPANEHREPEASISVH